MNARSSALLAMAAAGAMLAASPSPAQDPGHVVQGEGGLITALVLDPTTSSTLYATTARGLYKTIDGGRTWLPHVDGLGTHSVLALAVDPASRGLFAATDSGGVFRSADGAERWSAANTGIATRWIGAVAFDPKSPGVVYAGTEAGRLFKSVSGGKDWTEMKAPIPAVSLSAITVDPSDSNVIYVGTNSEGVFRTLDGGATWTRPTDRLKRGTIWNVTVDPANPSRVYVGTHDGLFRSVDRGMTWSAINKGMKSYNVLAVALDPAHTDTIYAATAIGIYKSPDAGATWSLLQGDLYVSALAVDPRDPRLVYAGTHLGVIKSSDAGARWVSLDFASRDKNATQTAVDGANGPARTLPVRRVSPAVPGLKPLPIRAPNPPVQEAGGQSDVKSPEADPKDGAVAVADGSAATESPAPSESGDRAAPPAAHLRPLPFAPRRPQAPRDTIAHSDGVKSAESGTKWSSREHGPRKDGAIPAVASVRPPLAARHGWVQRTGINPLQAQPARRLPARDALAGTRGRPAVAGGR